MIANAERFVAAWKRARGGRWHGHWVRLTHRFPPRSPEWDRWLPHLSPADWAADPKLSWPDDHFSAGRANPVLLTTMGLDGPTGVAIDGITRTLWLLVHQAPAFPIECLTRNAPALHAAIGQSGTAPHTVDGLGLTMRSDPDGLSLGSLIR